MNPESRVRGGWKQKESGLPSINEYEYKCLTTCKTQLFDRFPFSQKIRGGVDSVVRYYNGKNGWKNRMIDGTVYTFTSGCVSVAGWVSGDNRLTVAGLVGTVLCGALAWSGFIEKVLKEGDGVAKIDNQVSP